MLALEAPHGAAFDFLVLFAVVLAGPALMARARIPGIIGLLLGGWLIGPHGLDLIGQGNQTVPELGQLGLLYLMFVAGLELDLGMLRLHRRTAVVFGLLTFLLPFVGGLAVGAALDFSLPAALLLGSLLASHTLLIYPMVRDAGIGGNRAVASAVGATVLTDTIALVVLAGVAGSETGSGSSVYLEITVGLIVLAVVTLVVLPRLAVLVIRRLGGDRSVRFLVALIAFLGAASLSEVFGIEGIVGAFFAGLAMNRLVPNEGQTMHRIEFFGSAVFVPIFLVSTGLLLDPSVMFTAETLGYGALFVVACLGGKALAALLTRLLFGVTGPESGVMFVLTAPQAAATLAATVVGFEIGLFSTTVVNAVLVLILVSIVVASVLAPRFIRGTSAAVDLPERLGERVLLAVDDATPSRTAAELATRIARHDDGVVDVVLLRRSSHRPVDRTPVPVLEVVVEREGFDGEVHVAVHRSAAHAVVDSATALDASLVIVEHGAGLEPGPLGVGHWTDAVAASVPTPLALLEGEAGGIGRVVVVVPADPEPVPPPAVDFVRTLAGLITTTPPHEVVGIGTTWVQELAGGDVAIVPVPTWELVVGLPSPPPGAAIVAVPVQTITAPLV